MKIRTIITVLIFVQAAMAQNVNSAHWIDHLKPKVDIDSKTKLAIVHIDSDLILGDNSLQGSVMTFIPSSNNGYFESYATCFDGKGGVWLELRMMNAKELPHQRMKRWLVNNCPNLK